MVGRGGWHLTEDLLQDLAERFLRTLQELRSSCQRSPGYGFNVDAQDIDKSWFLVPLEASCSKRRRADSIP